MSERTVEELLVAVASPAAHEDSPERKVAWDEIKRRMRHLGLATLREVQEGVRAAEKIDRRHNFHIPGDSALAVFLNGIDEEVGMYYEQSKGRS